MAARLAAGLAASLAAVLSSSVAAPAQTADYRTLQRQQILFFQKVARLGHPFAPRVPPAAMRARHAGPPASPPAARKAAAAAPVTEEAAGATAPRAEAFAGGTAAFYLSAHPDDYALFTFPYRDVGAPDTRVVFIFITAGDAGLGVGPTGAPYYLARENAAMKGIRFMADAAAPWPASGTTGAKIVNGRSIPAFSYRNTVAYFLRLPDGNGGGEGFPGTGNMSIARLRSGAISSLRAVNGSTTYRGWMDLLQTIGAIVTSESAGQPNVWLYANDPNTDRNPGDHSDHLTTGAMVETIQSAAPCINAAYHLGYSMSGLSNLPQTEARNKAGTFASYASGLNEKGYYGAWDDAHTVWLPGLMARLAPGNGTPCAF